ncbi:hypothetical protein [Streptomyces sp. NPDC059003]|uniref:terpene synthase family protein n=1 Tax=Streptomyces sp. NPDC059003 TaxID=3346691 RepID=UPI00369CF089
MASSEDATRCIVPAVTSRFAPRQHPADDALRRHTLQFCETRFNTVARGKYDAAAGGYAEVGGRFVSLLYPEGEEERVQVASLLMLAWVLVDDRIDASLDTDHINRILDELGDAVWLKTPAREPEYHIIADFFGRSDWEPGTLRRCRSGMESYIDGTRVWRAIEITEKPITVDDYMNIRPDNLGWDILLPLHSYVAPAAAAEHRAAESTDTYRAIYRDTGTCVGIALDLGLVNGIRDNHTAWTNIDAILHRSAPKGRSHQDAVDEAIALFHGLEERIKANLTALESPFPSAAAGLRNVYAGSIAWIHELRGRRYAAVDT